MRVHLVDAEGIGLPGLALAASVVSRSRGGTFVAGIGRPEAGERLRKAGLRLDGGALVAPGVRPSAWERRLPAGGVTAWGPEAARILRSLERRTHAYLTRDADAEVLPPQREEVGDDWRPDLGIAPEEFAVALLGEPVGELDCALAQLAVARVALAGVRCVCVAPRGSFDPVEDSRLASACGFARFLVQGDVAALLHDSASVFDAALWLPDASGRLRGEAAWWALDLGIPVIGTQGDACCEVAEGKNALARALLRLAEGDRAAAATAAREKACAARADAARLGKSALRWDADAIAAEPVPSGGASGLSSFTAR